MGNIRPTYIKRTAIKLLKEYPDVFTEDFQHNKEMLNQLADIQSVILRNKVAGYIVRYKKVHSGKL
jgi:small subunit ribosomal protein S17e